MKGFDISIIYTFHNEGMVIYKTFLALERMLKKLDENGINYEIIAHIDNGDAKTKKYVDELGKKFVIQVYENSFGEPSQSRNYAVSKANGKYVCLMDGDDLFSENWLIDAYRIQEESKEDVILHPEYNLTFGLDEQPRLWRMKDSFDLNTDILILFGRNRWCSGTFLKRSIAKKNPYKKTTGCYGFEDWHYNCETRYKGIKHNVVPDSILFYRVRKGSTYSKHTGENTTIDYCEAFSLENMKKLYRKDFSGPRTKNFDENRSLRFLQIGHKVLRHTPIIRKADRRITRVIEQRRAEKKMKTLPQPLIKEWRAINRIDGMLYPDKEVISRMPIYDSELDYYGKAYCRIAHQLDRNPDYVFMPPIMSIGGTEKVLENYLNILHQLHPEWYIVVFGKLPDGHPYKIPSNVAFIDFDYITNGFEEWEKNFILTKFVVQTKVRRLHIIGNERYYRWALDNRGLIKTNNIMLNCSFFMHEYSEDEQRIQSFADSYFVELEPYINKVFTDNAVIAKDLIERTGFLPEKVSVHYQPVNFKMRVPHSNDIKDHYKILWAGRVAPQKRPDILKKIAEKLPNNYSIDVYGRIQKPYFKDNYFVGAKNISYKGSFDNVSSLPIEDYDVYLYTAQTDGIPNILLEMTALGLPIVATREGGVPDLINDEENGKLVDLNDIDGYIEALKEITEGKKRLSYVKKSQAKIKERHSWENYKKIVEKDLK